MIIRILIALLGLTVITGCSVTGTKGRLGELRAELKELQDDKKVLLYAPAELKEAEDALIKAVNLWNQGSRQESMHYADLSEKAMEKTRRAKQAAVALGLSDEAWEQRRWLIEVRERRLRSES